MNLTLDKEKFQLHRKLKIQLKTIQTESQQEYKTI